MQKFKIEANGYNKEEVNLFINNFIKETESLLKICEKQKNYIKTLENKINEYKNLEEEIIKKAKDYASVIVNDALKKSSDIEKERVIMEKNLKHFKQRMNKLLQDENILLEEINKLVVTDE